MFDVLNATDFVVARAGILDTGSSGRSADQATRKISIHRRQCSQSGTCSAAPDPPLGMPTALDRRALLSQRPVGRNGLAAGVLNHPRRPWHGSPTRSPPWIGAGTGQVVLAGSFIRPIETRKGDTIQADYGAYGP